MNLTEFRDYAESHGIQEAAGFLAEGIRASKVKLDGFSLRKLWEVCIGPVDETLTRAMMGPGGVTSGLIEEVRSMAFTDVTSAVLINRVQASYDDVPSVLDELVTPFSSNMRTERMVGFTAADGPWVVPEGGVYPETGFADRATESPEPDKLGMQINITDEAIKFDRTGQIVSRAQMIGRKLKTKREDDGILVIEDSTAGYYSFYPMVNGSATRTAIWRSSAAGAEWYNKTVNLKTSNALADWSDVEGAWLLYKDIADEAGDPIMVNPDILLVPMALKATAHFIVNAIQSRKSTASAANVALASNVTDQLTPGLKIITSPFLASASTWWLGDFKSQFVEQVIIPTEMQAIPGDPRRDIVQSFVARRKSRVSAVDDKFVIENTA